MKKTVLITGARGLIGSVLREALTPNYTVLSLSRHPIPDVESIQANINDLPALITAFQGVDNVIHMAASASIWSSWDDVLQNNLIGTYNVYQAAVEAGVKQVIFASSNHAVGNYDHDNDPHIYQTGEPFLDHNVPVRPDSLYGASKCFGESLGRYFAENHGLHILCLRIGFINRWDAPPRQVTPDPNRDQNKRESPERLASIWLSHRDMVQLIEKSLLADHVKYDIVYGISNNQPHFYDLEHAREVLGFEPQDGAIISDVYAQSTPTE
ncbi:MAG TPA: NAD(P)-dependent oxidoreductase [Dictyobacter sp.]|nr:NAD(P)-dependent oxidoreductase [Dictyobacter sp.]